MVERDAFDPRNFDVIHTYTRVTNEASCFYPSITAVASSTSTSNCAATVLGPVELTPLSLSQTASATGFSILQNELTTKGKAYLVQVDKQVVFLSHQNSEQ